MRTLLCIIFGHWPKDLSVGLSQAHCGRCERLFHVHYDMAYGETVFDDEIATPSLIK